ncbi:MAG TPA: signal peptidase I [Patescibacteria group bacterium]|nr:signal peptidase I [Patescibacteria group bacterium]
MLRVAQFNSNGRIAARRNKSSSVSKTRALQFLAKGQSMFPMIAEGDTVYIERISPLKVKVGDIICFLRGKKLVTHRVLARKEDSTWVTKGDRPLLNDRELVTKDNLIGRVSRIKTASGKRIIPNRYPYSIVNLAITQYMRLTLKFPWLRKINKGGQPILTTLFGRYMSL